jgi:hypothetical protein
MPVPIHTRAAKYLDNKPFYHTAAEFDCSELLTRLTLSPAETVIGVYENKPGNIDVSIVVTNLGLHRVDTNAVQFVAYIDIDTMQLPSHDMNAVFENVSMRRLLLKLTDGSSIEFPIVGIKGKRALDVLSFHMFISGACQTVEIENRKKAPNGERATA